MTVLIIVVALIGALVGYIQGAIKQIANLAGIIVGLLLAVTAYDKFGKVLADFTGAEDKHDNHSGQDSGQVNMPDPLVLVGAVHNSRLMELRIDRGQRRQVDNAAPAGILPDIRTDIQRAEPARLTHEMNPFPS